MVWGVHRPFMSTETPSVAKSNPVQRPTLDLGEQRRWTIVLLLFVASSINYLDRTTLSFALPLVSEGMGLDPKQKGYLLSAFFWSYALMQIPIGVLADRVNLRWLYAGAFALWSLAQGLTGLATTLGVLIGFRVVLGMGEAIYLPGGTKIVSLLFSSSERGFPCGLFDSGTRAGMFLGGLIIPWFLQQYGWRRTFAVIGFSALLWLVPWIWATPRSMKVQARPTTPTGAQLLEVAVNPRGGRDLIGICLGFFCFDYYWYLLVTWLPDYLVNVRHLTIIKAGLFASLPFLVFAVCQPLGGWIGDQLVRRGWDETRARKWIVSVSFLSGLFLIPAARTGNPHLAIALIMAGCLVGLSTANQLVILQGCAPRDRVGLWTGIYNCVGNFAGILAPIITGYVIEWTGSYTPAFVIAAVMIAAGQLSYWFLVGEIRCEKT
jgi:MFS family permease